MSLNSTAKPVNDIGNSSHIIPSVRLQWIPNLNIETLISLPKAKFG